MDLNHCTEFIKTKVEDNSCFKAFTDVEKPVDISSSTTHADALYFISVKHELPDDIESQDLGVADNSDQHSKVTETSKYFNAEKENSILYEEIEQSTEMGGEDVNPANKIIEANMDLQDSNVDYSSYSCVKCKETFYREDQLNDHMEVHGSEKKYTCSHCQKSFSQKRYLNEHIRIHTGEKPYLCKECGKSYSQRGTFNEHMRSHTGERPYLCTYCGKSFGRNCHLRKHQRIHTGERLFICTDCGKSFLFNGDLSKHVKTHAVEKAFGCSQCGKGFSRKSNLEYHLKTHAR